jgi:hypothetical protein
MIPEQTLKDLFEAYILTDYTLKGCALTNSFKGGSIGLSQGSSGHKMCEVGTITGLTVSDDKAREHMFSVNKASFEKAKKRRKSTISTYRYEEGFLNPFTAEGVCLRIGKRFLPGRSHFNNLYASVVNLRNQPCNIAYLLAVVSHHCQGGFQLENFLKCARTQREITPEAYKEILGLTYEILDTYKELQTLPLEKQSA